MNTLKHAYYFDIPFTLKLKQEGSLVNWSYALAGFLVSTLFGVSPDQS